MVSNLFPLNFLVLGHNFIWLFKFSICYWTINETLNYSNLPKIFTQKSRQYSDINYLKENLNLPIPKLIEEEEEETTKIPTISPEEEEFQKIIEKEIEELEINNKLKEKQKQPAIVASAVVTIEETTIIPENNDNEDGLGGEEDVEEFVEDEQQIPFIGGDINNYVTLLPTQNFPSQEISSNSLLDGGGNVAAGDCSSSNCQSESIEGCGGENGGCVIDNNNVNILPSPNNNKFNEKLICGSCSCSICQCSSFPDPCNGPNCGICPSTCNCPEECGCTNTIINNNQNYQQQYNQWFKEYGQQQYGQYNQYYQNGGGGGSVGAFTTLQCFSGDQLVNTPRGEKRMDELKIGDLVLSVDESLVAYSPILMFLHRLPNEKAKFKIITTLEGQQLKLTEFHLVWAGCSNLRLIRAKDLNNGECLYTVKNKRNNITSLIKSKEMMRLSSTKIIKINEIEENGIYAPLTSNGNILVNGLLASCHSNIAAQTLQQTFFRCWHFLHQLLFDGGNSKCNLENEIEEFLEEKELPFGIRFLTSILDILLPKTLIPT
ncbi:unnamed protein product [Meloidogyne enterolobii]|uniref:Uncharacterized protein n=1 Tax=Meloidogyne enterolobii TaxID=390850 RepID=A0ACB0ZGY2_MELEN